MGFRVSDHRCLYVARELLSTDCAAMRLEFLKFGAVCEAVEFRTKDGPL